MGNTAGHRRKRYLLTLLMTGGLLLLGGSLVAADGTLPLTPSEREWIAAHPQVFLVPDPNYHPIEFIDAAGTHRGIAADYIALLEQRLGLQFKALHPQDWEQALEWARTRKADIMTAAAQTPQRSEYLIFTKPYLEIPAVIITQKRVTAELTLKKLHNIKVGVISGDAVQEFMQHNHPGLNLDIVPNIPTGLKKLSFGMIDAFVGDLTTISHHIEQEGITNLRVAGQTAFSYQLSFAARKDWPMLYHLLEKGLASISAEERQAIYRKWVQLSPQDYLADREFWQTVFGIFVAALLAVTVFIALNRALRKQVAFKTAELTESEEKYRVILDNAVEGIFQSSPEGKFLRANDALAHLLGYASAAELMADSDLAQRIYVDPRQRTALWQRVVKEGIVRNFEVELHKKDGIPIWIICNVRAVQDDTGKVQYLEGFITDITERKLAENARRESERRLATLMGNLPGMAYRCRNDKNWTMEFISEGCRALTGYAPQDLIDNRTLAYADIIIPEDRDMVWQTIQQALQKKEPFRLEYRAKTADGDEVWFWEQGRGIFSQEEELLALEGFVADITEHKKAEKTLRDSDRMKSEFVSMASHELRTPLTVISGFSEFLLSEEPTSPAQQAEYLSIIYNKAKTLEKIIDDLLDISRVESGQDIYLEKEWYDLVDTLRTLVDQRRQRCTTHHIQTSLPDVPAKVYVDNDKFIQVMENLLSNAIKFSEEGSLIQVTCEASTKQLEISVADQGCGMTPEQTARIFEKFYRADSSSTSKEGLGLGMAIVKHIVEAHGGQIWVESQLGTGTTVRLTLPMEAVK